MAKPRRKARPTVVVPLRSCVVMPVSPVKENRKKIVMTTIGEMTISVQYMGISKTENLFWPNEPAMK